MEVLKKEVNTLVSQVYLNYNYYNWSGTWGGFQTIILTVQVARRDTREVGAMSLLGQRG